MHFQAINHKDARANFEYNDLYRFSRAALFGIQCYGWDCWTFSGGGVQLDPVDDLNIPETVEKMAWTEPSWMKKGKA